MSCFSECYNAYLHFRLLFAFQKRFLFRFMHINVQKVSPILDPWQTFELSFKSRETKAVILLPMSLNFTRSVNPTLLHIQARGKKKKATKSALV